MLCDRIPDFGVGNDLDIRNQVPDLTRQKTIDLLHFGSQHTNAFDRVHLTVGHQPYFHSWMDFAVNETHQYKDAAIHVKPRIEEESFQGGIRIAFRSRNSFNDRFENFLHAISILSADEQGILGIHSDDRIQLLARSPHIGAGKIDLIDDRQDLEMMIESQVGIGERLRLYSLRCIDNQKSALASCKASRNFVTEVDVAWRIDQIQDVIIAVL